MKLLFEKNDSQTVVVKIDHEGNIQDFDYVTMLQRLLDYGVLDDSELTGDFSETERTSIASMVAKLNDCVPVNNGKLDSADLSDIKDNEPESVE